MKKAICTSCRVEKSADDFHKNKSEKNGLQARCKPCMSLYKKNRYWGNREIELAKMTKSRLKPENVEQRRGYYERNKGEYRKRHLKYMSDENKAQQKRDRGKEYYQKNKDKVKLRHKNNYEKAETKEKIREKHHIRKHSDLVYIIRRRLRFRLRHIIKALGDNKYKRMSSLDLLGCDMEFFKKYIENKFTEGMSWNRLGEIHIDHIKPCAKFDLTKIEEQKICFHYTNLQPLWKEDNLKKNDKYPYKIAS